MAENGRPGGWVEGIGWVARPDQLPDETECIDFVGDPEEPWLISGADGFGPEDARPVIVIRWADGETPTAPAPLAPLPVADSGDPEPRSEDALLPCPSCGSETASGAGDCPITTDGSCCRGVQVRPAAVPVAEQEGRADEWVDGEEGRYGDPDECHPNQGPHPLYPERGTCGCGEAMYDAPPAAAPSPDVAGEVAALREELENQRLMHKAYRPEVVAEIAVQLTEDADWQEIATWCGGTLRHSSDSSGEVTTYLDLPGVGSVCQGMWITLDHDGRFRARAEIAAPSPDVERAERTDTVADALRALYARWPSGMTAEVDGMFRSLFKSLSPAAPASPVPEVQPDPGEEVDRG